MAKGKKVWLAGVALMVIGAFGANTIGGVGLLLLVIGLIISFVEGRRGAV